MQMALTAEPIDAQRALSCNLVGKVVPHQELLAEAELLASQVLRNSQRAVRSAKETILEVIGKALDDQLRLEGWNSYSCLDPGEASGLLEEFYRRSSGD
jgi:enoyl-CoA hydratase/carnithine racemase